MVVFCTSCLCVCYSTEQSTFFSNEFIDFKPFCFMFPLHIYRTYILSRDFFFFFFVYNVKCQVSGCFFFENGGFSKGKSWVISPYPCGLRLQSAIGRYTNDNIWYNLDWICELVVNAYRWGQLLPLCQILLFSLCQQHSAMWNYRGTGWYTSADPFNTTGLRFPKQSWC